MRPPAPAAWILPTLLLLLPVTAQAVTIKVSASVQVDFLDPDSAARDLTGVAIGDQGTMVFRFDTDDLDPCGGTDQFSYLGQLDSGITDSAFGAAPGDGCPPDEDLDPVLFVNAAHTSLSWLNDDGEGSFLNLDTNRWGWADEPGVVVGGVVLSSRVSSPVPEPSAALVFAIGLAVVTGGRRRRRP